MPGDCSADEWRQGDCFLGEAWFVHRFDSKQPLTPESKRVGDDIDLCETQVDGFVVLTQTCDIVRSATTRPYVQVAPLVEVDDQTLGEVRRLRRPQYVFIPEFELRRLVGDLDRVMTVEKCLLEAWERSRGCGTDEEARAFAAALARKSSRFASPADFYPVASALIERISEKHDKQTDEGRALRSLRDIRVQAGPSWEAAQVDLFFWFIREEGEPTFEGIPWDQLLSNWLQMLKVTGRYRGAEGVVVVLADLTAYDYVYSDPLDLEHLTGRPSP